MSQRYHSLHPAQKLQLLSPPLIPEYRKLLEEWIREYPARQRSEIRRRLFDPATSLEDHYAARVETYVNHVLVCKGWRIQRHPKIAGVSTRPDFRVWHPGGRFMIEVKASLEAERLRKHEDAVLELVDALADICTHFCIHMEPVSPISQSISKHRIRTFLERELA